MNTAAQVALAASISAIAVAVADVGKAIANHPTIQADDSGDILKAAEELQGFATQLEGLSTSLNPPAVDQGDGTTAAQSSDGDGTTVVEQPGEPAAPEAGSEGHDGGTLEPTPDVVDDGSETGEAAVS